MDDTKRKRSYGSFPGDNIYTEDDQQPLTTGTSYEDAVAATGYGKFHYILLAMCGWALSSDAIEVLSISFVLPPATSDLNLTNADKGWLTAIIFVGMMIGGYMWGGLADLYGRRRVLLVSLTVNGLGGLTSSLAQSYGLFLFLRFVSGVGVGGSMPVIFSYFVEFQSKEKRGHMISLLATFWMSGSIICAGLAWLIIPHTDVGIFTESFTYNSWRIFLLVCTAPAISSGLFFSLMPESPRFLLNAGRAEEALLILKKMFKRNNPNKNPAYDFQLASSTAALFDKPLRRTSVVMIIIFFTLSFGYYGLFMWFPELFNRMEQSGGGSPCALLPIVNNTNTTVSPNVSMDIYVESFLTSASNLPGNIFTFLVIDRIRNGRNILLALSMVVSGCCVFFIALLNNKLESVIMSCVFSGISVIGWNALDVIGMEVYPTHLRSTAGGFEMGIGRIASILANLIFGLLVGIQCLVPMFLVAGFMCIGGLSAFALPNMAGRDIDMFVRT